MIVWDIETGPQPREQLAKLAPKPGDIKLGNLKDPDKIRAKVLEKQEEFYEKAALCATTGQVLAIGWFNGKDCHIDTQDKPPEEDLLLGRFWDSCNQGAPLVGHNIHGFDLPFLVRRSWLLGVSVPDWVLQDGRYWSPKFVDTMKVWGCGAYGEYIGIADISLALGGPGKPEGISGGDFAALFENDRPRAIEYLKNDLAMTWTVAEALQIG